MDFGATRGVRNFRLLGATLVCSKIATIKNDKNLQIGILFCIGFRFINLILNTPFLKILVAPMTVKKRLIFFLGTNAVYIIFTLLLIFQLTLPKYF